MLSVNQLSAVSPPPGFTESRVVPPPPGFTESRVVPPPPGFGAIISSQTEPPSYIRNSSYFKRKDEFRTKIFELFDGDMNLFVEYDQFCEAFSQNKITTNDFIIYTMQLFKEKFNEYLLELIVIMPNIEKQNELYTRLKNDTYSASISSGTPQSKSNWAKNNLDDNNIYICLICRQIMFTIDADEHKSYHTGFDAQFPSLPTTAVSIGRGGRKKNK